MVHAEQIATLGSRGYPEAFALTSDHVRDTLASLQPSENLCFGVFREEDLIGYLLCWLDVSQVEGREDEPVLLLDDIVVLGSSRRYLWPLLQALRRGILDAGYADLPIEGTHRKQAEELFSSHPELVRRLGYELAARHRYYGEREREELCWARYEPVRPT